MFPDRFQIFAYGWVNNLRTFNGRLPTMFLQCFRFPELNQWKTHKHEWEGQASDLSSGASALLSWEIHT